MLVWLEQELMLQHVSSGAKLAKAFQYFLMHCFPAPLSSQSKIAFIQFSHLSVRLMFE